MSPRAGGRLGAACAARATEAGAVWVRDLSGPGHWTGKMNEPLTARANRGAPRPRGRAASRGRVSARFTPPPSPGLRPAVDRGFSPWHARCISRLGPFDGPEPKGRARPGPPVPRARRFGPLPRRRVGDGPDPAAHRDRGTTMPEQRGAEIFRFPVRGPAAGCPAPPGSGGLAASLAALQAALGEQQRAVSAWRGALARLRAATRDLGESMRAYDDALDALGGRLGAPGGRDGPAARRPVNAVARARVPSSGTGGATRPPGAAPAPSGSGPLEVGQHAVDLGLIHGGLGQLRAVEQAEIGGGGRR